MTETAASPSTPEQIVDLIRAENWKKAGGHAISTGEAIALIEQYAAVAAAEAAIKATTESFDKAIAITDAALSMPLATTARIPAGE